MIIDKLENLNKYFNDQNLANAVLQFLQNAKSVDAGKYYITDTTFANVLEYQTKVFETVKMEAHVKYVDLQYLVSGTEKVMIENKGNEKPINEYNDVKDVIHYSPAHYEQAVFHEGEFAIMLPNDLHQCVSENAPMNIKKVVVKIPVEIF